MAVRARAPVELVLLVPGLLGPAGAGAGDPDAVQALLDGLDDRGSSFDRYRDAFGKSGGHHLRVHVFRRDGEPCERERCRGRRITRTRIGGRATHYCGSCQRA